MIRTKKHVLAEIAALKEELATAGIDYDEYEAEVEVTVGLTAKDAWRYLPFTLPALWGQGCRIDVCTYVDESSDLMTKHDLSSDALKQTMENHLSGAVREYRFLGVQPAYGVEQAQAMAKHNIAFEAHTPYLFYLDADVVLPPNAIRDALAELKADPKLGGVCVPYNYVQEHPLQGALCMSREVALALKFQHFPRCVCRNLAEKMATVGLELKHWQRGDMAEHRKWSSGPPRPREVVA